MARADLLKKLFDSYRKHDDAAFREAAAELITDEKKKHHDVLAAELTRILNSSTSSLEKLNRSALPYDPLPVDVERQTPLVHVKAPDRFKEDLVLSPEVLEALDRIIREFRSSEILEAHGLQPTRRVLFCGPSGCGKTVSAEVVASELSMPLLYVRFDSVVSSLLGETAANLRKVFDYATRGQWVILFDEFDAIGRSRDDSTEHGEIKRVVNSFLQLIDNFSGRSLVIAATNFEQALDPAVWRRFDDVVRFPKPDRAALAELVQKRLGGLVVSKQLADVVSRSLTEASHADAERVCIDIRKSCILDASPGVRKQDVETALARWKHRCQTLAKAAHKGTPSVDDE